MPQVADIVAAVRRSRPQVECAVPCAVPYPRRADIVAAELILPRVDMDMSEGKIARWYVQNGDAVTKGQLVFEIETDKATMEIESPADGIVQGVDGEVGVNLPVGRIVGWILGPGESIPGAAGAAAANVERSADPGFGRCPGSAFHSKCGVAACQVDAATADAASSAKGSAAPAASALPPHLLPHLPPRRYARLLWPAASRATGRSIYARSPDRVPAGASSPPTSPRCRSLPDRRRRHRQID